MFNKIILIPSIFITSCLLSGCTNSIDSEIVRDKSGNVQTEKLFIDNDTAEYRCVDYYLNGNVKSTYYEKDSLYHGYNFNYYLNGKIESEGNWELGKKKGFFKYYDSMERLDKVVEFINFRDSLDRPNQIIKLGVNNDTVLNGQSLFYEFYRVKDTIKLGKELYEFKVVLKGHVFPNALLRICDFDNKFNLIKNGKCDELEFDKGYAVIGKLHESKYIIGKNVLRGEIVNYDKFKTMDGKDTLKAVRLFLEYDFYVER